MVNKVILVGRVGRDPELRYTPNGTPVANLSLATSERSKGSDGKWQEHTEWHNITAWRKLAEIIGEFVKKGSLIYVEGKLKTRSWESSGTKHYRTDVHIEKLHFLDGRDSKGSNKSSNQFGNDGFEPDTITDDDIPF